MKNVMSKKKPKQNNPNKSKKQVKYKLLKMLYAHI